MHIEFHKGDFKNTPSLITTNPFITMNEVLDAMGMYNPQPTPNPDPNAFLKTRLQPIIDSVPDLFEFYLNKYILERVDTVYYYNFSNFRYYFNDPLKQLGQIVIYKGNITAVNSIKYMKNGVLTTVNPLNYHVDIRDCCVEIVAKGDGFPIDYDLLNNEKQSQPKVVEIEVTGGYDINTIPKYLKQKMLETIMYLYNNSPSCGCDGNCTLPQLVVDYLKKYACLINPVY